MCPTKIPFYISVRVCIQSHCISGWHVTKIDLKSLNVKQQGFDRKNVSAPGQENHITLITSYLWCCTWSFQPLSFSVPRCATPHLQHVSRFKQLISTATSCCFFSSLVSCNEWTNPRVRIHTEFRRKQKKINLNLFGFFDLKAYSGKQASDIQWECLFTGCLLNSKPENQSQTQVSETPEAFYQTINFKTANRESQLRCSRH